MTGRIDAERILDAFLAPEPDQLPDRVLDAALAKIARTPQRRALRVPWRFQQVSTSMRLAAAIALAAIVGGGALIAAGGWSTPTPTAEPTATTTPTEAGIDTNDWVSFTSERYGYRISHPAEWEVEPASRMWLMPQDRTDWLSPGQDQFVDREASFQSGVHGFAVDVVPGTSGDEWIDAFLAGTPCFVPAADLPTIEVNGFAAKLADQQACSDTIAFAFIEPRMYVFTIGRENQVPLFMAFLSTVHFPPADPARLYINDWIPYTSAQYGFTLGHPPGWSESPATRAWTYEQDGRNFLTQAADAFRSPSGDIRVSAWLVPFGPGAEPEQSWEAVEAWITAYCSRTDITPCGVIHERAEHLCVEIRDCHPGLLVPFDDEVQAFFFGGISAEGGMTVVSVWWEDDASATAPYGGSRHLLEAFIGTMGVWPEDRRPDPRTAWPPPSPASS